MDQHDVQQIVDDAVDATERLIGRDLDDDEREALAAEIMGEGPDRYEQRRAPAGEPTVINGKPYQGGEFIPGDALAAASPQEKQELARREHETKHEIKREAFGYKINRHRIDAGAVRRAKAMGLGLETASDFAQFFGIEPDIDSAEACVTGPLSKDIEVEFQGKWGIAIRRIRDGAKGLEIENAFIELKGKGGGVGTRMIVREVRNAINAGVVRITCEAAGNARDEAAAIFGEEQDLVDRSYYTGYRHWPAIGFDGPIPNYLILPEEFKTAKTVLDLLEMPGGEKWWRKNGVSFKAEFDLTPGSRSRRVLTRYLLANAQRLYGGGKPMKFQNRR